MKSFSTPRGMMTIAGLEIFNVTQADGGTYSVKATNMLGEANANINLNFSSMYCFHFCLNFTFPHLVKFILLGPYSEVMSSIVK